MAPYADILDQRLLQIEQQLLPILAAMINDPLPERATQLVFDFQQNYSQMVVEIVGLSAKARSKTPKPKAISACVLQLNWLQAIRTVPDFNYYDFIKQYPNGYEQLDDQFLERFPQWWCRAGGNHYPISAQLNVSRRQIPLAWRENTIETAEIWKPGVATTTPVPRPADTSAESPTSLCLSLEFQKNVWPQDLGNGLMLSGHLWSSPNLYTSAISWQEGNGDEAVLCFAEWPMYHQPMIFERTCADGGQEKLLVFHDHVGADQLKAAQQVTVVRKRLTSNQ